MFLSEEAPYSYPTGNHTYQEIAVPPPVPPPPSSEALNGTVLDPLDQWQPSSSRFTHQQVRWGQVGRSLKGEGEGAEGVYLVGHWGNQWKNEIGRIDWGIWLSPIRCCSSHPPRDRDSDQELITSVIARLWKFPGETGGYEQKLIWG